MEARTEQEITRILGAWEQGESGALEQLLPLVEAELRRLARNYLERESPGHTLQPTALVNEVFIRLLGGPGHAHWRDRRHFFGFAATTMRHILVDHARARRTAKRGGGAQRLALEDVHGLSAREDGVDLVELNEAMEQLAELDERQARIVELRAFAGLSLAETAGVLEVSESTVSRDWASARAWLYRELTSSVADAP